MPAKHLTILAAAKLKGCSPTTVARAVSAGKIRRDEHGVLDDRRFAAWQPSRGGRPAGKTEPDEFQKRALDAVRKAFDAGFSYSDIARAAGISASTARHLHQGIYTPQRRTARKISMRLPRHTKKPVRA